MAHGAGVEAAPMRNPCRESLSRLRPSGEIVLTARWHLRPESWLVTADQPIRGRGITHMEGLVAAHEGFNQDSRERGLENRTLTSPLIEMDEIVDRRVLVLRVLGSIATSRERHCSVRGRVVMSVPCHCVPRLRSSGDRRDRRSE